MKLQLHDLDEVRVLLAARVRLLRLAAGWKQLTLAQRAGISLPTLRRYERTGTTSLENFLRLCQALGCLDDVAKLLQPAPAGSIAELTARELAPARRRGRQ